LAATQISFAVTPRNDTFVPIGYLPTTYWRKANLYRNLITAVQPAEKLPSGWHQNRIIFSKMMCK